MFDAKHFQALIRQECDARIGYFGFEMTLKERPAAYLMRLHESGEISLYDAWRHFQYYLTVLGWHLINKNSDDNAAGWACIKAGKQYLEQSAEIRRKLRAYDPPMWMFWRKADPNALDAFDA